MSYPVIPISERAAHQIQKGTLWVFSNEIPMKKVECEKGALCVFKSPSGFTATGYFNPQSLIAGRILSLGGIEIISDFLFKRLLTAFEKRKDYFNSGCARLVFSESDFLPGLIVDWYGTVLVLQSNTAGMDALLPKIKEIIPEVYKKVFKSELENFVIRGDSSIRTLEGIPEFSEFANAEKVDLANTFFKEDDIYFRANFLEGQKTGFFLDQKENRRTFGEIVKKEKLGHVLDLFCYSGGWGLRALKEGALSVTFVDQSEEALALVKEAVKKNGFDEKRVKYVRADAFEFLEGTKENFDAIVVDPPAFVKSKKILNKALAAYEKLNRGAWRRLKVGGVFFTCSCSYHVSEADFYSVVKSALSKELQLATLFYRGGQSLDHPILLSMPETNYLKCLGIRKILSD